MGTSWLLLIIESFRSHLADCVWAELEELWTGVAVIPGVHASITHKIVGCTSFFLVPHGGYFTKYPPVERTDTRRIIGHMPF